VRIIVVPFERIRRSSIAPLLTAASSGEGRGLSSGLVRGATLGILEGVPIYEYKCRKCGKRFEELVKIGETPECPRCHDPRPEQLFSMTAAVSTSTTREKSLRIARSVAQATKREKDHADAVYHSNYIKEHSEPSDPPPKKKPAAAARKPKKKRQRKYFNP
jgi:putative FmdB family regulatory protein